MRSYRLRPISWIAACALAGVFSSAAAAHGQANFDAQQAAALSAAAEANPDFIKGLAKELGSTPEQAAGVAGVLFTITKALITPEDFAQVEKAVPGMNALLAAVPADAVGTSGATSALPGASFTPTAGFASSSPAAITMPASASAPAATPITAQNWIGSAIAGFMKMGIKPDMIAKAVPYLSGYLKKHGTKALGSLIGGVLKTPK
jgi:hypothetical protein